MIEAAVPTKRGKDFTEGDGKESQRHSRLSPLRRDGEKYLFELAYLLGFDCSITGCF